VLDAGDLSVAGGDAALPVARGEAISDAQAAAAPAADAAAAVPANVSSSAPAAMRQASTADPGHNPMTAVDAAGDAAASLAQPAGAPAAPPAADVALQREAGQPCAGGGGLPRRRRSAELRRAQPVWPVAELGAPRKRQRLEAAPGEAAAAQLPACAAAAKPATSAPCAANMPADQVRITHSSGLLPSRHPERISRLTSESEVI